MQQKLFQNIFLSTNWSFWKQHRKGTAKTMPKIKKKKTYFTFYREYMLFLQSTASGSFLQTCINFVEQRRKFSNFEGSTIP